MQQTLTKSKGKAKQGKSKIPFGSFVTLTLYGPPRERSVVLPAHALWENQRVYRAEPLPETEKLFNNSPAAHTDKIIDSEYTEPETRTHF